MNELFNDLPDVLDAKALAHALSISKSGAYTLLNQKDFPTLRIGESWSQNLISFAGWISIFATEA